MRAKRTAVATVATMAVAGAMALGGCGGSSDAAPTSGGGPALKQDGGKS